MIEVDVDINIVMFLMKFWDLIEVFNVYNYWWYEYNFIFWIYVDW